VSGKPWVSTQEHSPDSKNKAGRASGLFCVLLFLCSVLLVHPSAEIGMVDDWSTMRSALSLAQTGHIQYNGWEAAILGWQLFPAAALMRVFGPSFAICRLSVIVEACLLLYLFHRCLVRSGVLPWNATLGTLALGLSPLFLPVSTTFMTDIPGLLALVASFYCCLRALHAHRPATWIIAASLLSAIGGTARQTGWLGYLAFVPAVLWLLRKRRGVWISGAVSLGLSALITAACLHWYHHQRYAVQENLLAPLPPYGLVYASGMLIWLLLDVAVLSLPLLFPFTRQLPWKMACVIIVAVLAGWISFRNTRAFGYWTAPFLHGPGNYLSLFGIGTALPPHGEFLYLVRNPVRVTLTLLTLLGMAGLIRTDKGSTEPATATVPSSPSLRNLCALIAPFSVFYLVLLIPRSYSHGLFDRYALPLMFFASVLLLRLYQDRLGRRLPLIAPLLIALFAAYAIAGTHDLFARYRASAVALRELASAGIPRSALDGGWEFNGWTEIDLSGFAHDPSLKESQQDRIQTPKLPDRGCALAQSELFPDIHPQYTLALGPTLCGARSSFPPVLIRTWLPPFRQLIYINRVDQPLDRMPTGN
jgi:hypothetical protein